MKEFEGKRVLITGSAKGIGVGIAEVFAENGAELLLHYRTSPEEGEALRMRLADRGGNVRIFRADLGTKEGIDALFAEVDRVLGGLDAGIRAALAAAPERIVITGTRATVSSDAYRRGIH